jgi:hypothetical protein
VPPPLACHGRRITIDTRTETRGRNDNAHSYPTNLRPIIAAAALLGLSLTFASSPAAAQQWTPQQRAACEPDSMRLCQQYISDIGRVRSCMSHYRRYLSPACRAVFQGGAKNKVRRFRR